ncbi:MAG: hypothetical protein QOI65_1547 [Thermoleophilaceae bacterium]|nr:hypothetical protein [Thermoleophilaceae bacterium]
MPRPAWIALVAVVATGLVLTLAWMATDRRGFTQRLDTDTTVVVPAGHQVCRGSVKPEEAGVNGLRFQIDTAGRPGPPLALVVFLRHSRRAIVARGRIRGGYRTGLAEGPIRGSATGARTLSVCVHNLGRNPITIAPPAGRPSRRQVVATGGTGFREISLALVRKPNPTLLSLMPTALRRAELFRPGWVHTWAYWVLAVALLIAVPGLLARALAGVERDDAGGGA